LFFIRTSRDFHLAHCSRTSNPGCVLVQPGAPLPNTIVSCGYLIIRDFGVGWRHVKLAARNEQLFKDLLNRFETDKSLFFRIVGYSDCVGVERNNFLLRRGRARNVFNLLGSRARSCYGGHPCPVWILFDRQFNHCSKGE
jgi:hypothetical protein